VQVRGQQCEVRRAAGAGLTDSLENINGAGSNQATETMRPSEVEPVGDVRRVNQKGSWSRVGRPWNESPNREEQEEKQVKEGGEWGGRREKRGKEGQEREWGRERGGEKMNHRERWGKCSDMNHKVMMTNLKRWWGRESEKGEERRGKREDREGSEEEREGERRWIT
jgi:hypothetical protein